MTDSKRTPGPWDVRKAPIGGTSMIIRPIGAIRVCELIANDANAHLISAAPELLEALEAKMSASVHAERVEADKLARAAIAKAKGQSDG